MKIRFQDGLPYVTVIISQNGKQLQIDNALLDTGSAGTIFSSDKLGEANIYPHDTAEIRRVTGIGGDEFVVETAVDQVQCGSLQIKNCTIEIGAMDYNFPIDAILGFDFLQQTGAIIDLGKMEIRTE